MHRFAFACGLLVMLWTRAADSCGGFFCSQVPVDQGGENIVFSVDGGTVTAHIQIRYVGEAEDFAWILPLPTEPDAPEVSTDLLFLNLNQATAPRFSVNWHDDQDCVYFSSGGAEAQADSSGGEGEEVAEPPAVKVEFQGAVGPYEAVVITSDDAGAVTTWLADNGYDLPPETTDLLGPYVAADYHFVALRLQNDLDVGDIVPIKVRFAWDRPCVPLRLTAIAATEDMWVRMWVFGEARSIPLNYRHVLIDEAKVDWFSGGANYAQVVTDAADEAEGRAFVTEFAGRTAELEATWGGNLFYTEGQFDLVALAAIDDPAAFVDELLYQGFPSTPQTQQLLRTHIPMPQALVDKGVLEADFYNSLRYWQEQGFLDGLDFDPVAFAADLELLIVAPLQDAQALVDGQPYLTRLFTTISPDEMTEDPMFGLGADLPDVASLHEADIYTQCQGGTLQGFRIVLADGRIILVDADDDTRNWTYDDPSATVTVPVDSNAPLGTMARLRADLPGSESAEQLYEDRQGARVYDHGAAIDDILARHNNAVDEGCSCALGAQRTGRGPWGLLGVLALLATGSRMRRRRRNSRPAVVSSLAVYAAPRRAIND